MPPEPGSLGEGPPAPDVGAAARATPPPPTPTPPGGRVRKLGGPPHPDSGGVAQPGGGPRPKRERPIPRPGPAARPGGLVLATPPPIKQKPVEAKPPPQPATQKKLMELPDDVKQGKRTITVADLSKFAKQAKPVVSPPEVGDEADEPEDGKGKKRPGVVGRDRRHEQRAARQKERKGREGEQTSTRGLLLEEDDAPRRLRGRVEKQRKQQLKGTQPRKGKVPLFLPISVRALSEALGQKSGELLFKLRDHGAPTTLTINSTIEPLLAETVALDYGCELEIKRPLDAEDKLLAEMNQPDPPEQRVPRAPIVTIMGHVDHGKTSLLDKIRASNVAATEAGGITQVIRAWRVEHHGRPITFLDTPGHEAFTKMRARGAQVTDIAVIVVAADDGVMPQTEEAISHAKAAGVALVVAINKVDLPSANVLRTRQQLYGLEVLPDNMGGDVPFVETSAATGKGIDDLLENILLVAELKELKANPTKPASGTCLEAMLRSGEGVLATLLVQDGTLHKGDVILCGAAYGRVRALYDDLGRPITEAGPSVPVRLTGLDEIPNADDRFLVAPDLATAREIADKRKIKLQEAALVPRSVEPWEERITRKKIEELKVILKADFRGSIEAIRKELEKLQHDEVRVRVLHVGIGGITESDVQLALTSPEDTIIVGFNVVPDDRALALAEERGIQIREYSIIYNLTDDLRAALEGKLKPREEVVQLGRAVVRETFKISRVGTIAGCYVTQGLIKRSAKVRVIRDGVVIYPPPERTAGLESLKRFKDDAGEVREGFECGLKIAGYDDIKVGDVIEFYRVDQVQRTLQ
jgi:translation initiation factor IF-2